jgi:hypothetical protein
MRFWFSGPRIFGIRSGISLGREDFRARSRSSTTTSGAEPNSDKFVYVVSGGNLVKIGITANPNARLAFPRAGQRGPYRATSGLGASS